MPVERERDESGRPRNARPRDRTGRPLARGAADELADRQEPEAVVSTVDEALTRAVALSREGRCFEAHEFLEWIWKAGAADEQRDLWKGVTQVMVAGVHAQRGNWDGALRLVERGLGHLGDRPDVLEDLDLAALRRSAAAMAAALRDGAEPARVALPVLTLLR